MRTPSIAAAPPEPSSPSISLTISLSIPLSISLSVLALSSSPARAQCTGAACPTPCDSCAFPPVAGENPTSAEWMALFATIAERGGAADLPAIDEVEVGVDRARAAAPFPCRLLPAIGATESTILQFCEESGQTVISFDCGFGVMQVTSGADAFPGLEARADINVAAGAKILAQKWNGDNVFGGSFGDSDPAFVESWYFAVWAYNGFVYSNNPNNPDKPANRPPFHGPASLSRGSYPYQELVWGYLRNPLERDGAPMWQPLEVTYPDPTTIPNQSGLFSVNPPLPAPAHADPCVEQCPPAGCPPPELRTLILDDLDPLFTIQAEPGEETAADLQEHASGGFQDHFWSAALAAPGAATVRAHFEGVAPASGIFDVSGFVPLDPATSEDVRVTIVARGAPLAASYDQNVPGGAFVSLGAQAELVEGERVVVEVTNESSDGDATHRVGIDALRFTWRGDGAVERGGACVVTTDCAADAVCLDGSCTDGCERAACTEGSSCDRATGLCSSGEGEGEGEGGEGEGDPPGRKVVLLPPGCGCASSSSPASAIAGVAAALWVVLRVRRRGSSPVVADQIDPR